MLEVDRVYYSKAKTRCGCHFRFWRVVSKSNRHFDIVELPPVSEKLDKTHWRVKPAYPSYPHVLRTNTNEEIILNSKSKPLKLAGEYDENEDYVNEFDTRKLC